MASATRELLVSYGAFSVGGTTRVHLDGRLRIRKEFTRAEVSFAFIVIGSSAADFVSLCAAAEAAFRKPYQDLVVSQAGQVLFSLRHSSNTGLDTLPTIEKQEDLADTGRSRRYTVRIECGMPADNVSTSGLRDSTVDVAYSPARKRTVTISGVFTAVGTSTARARYDSAIAAFASSVLTALGGTYELAEEPSTRHSVNNKTLEFQRVYDEIIYQQGGSALDDAAIVRQNLSISRRDDAPGDSIGDGSSGGASAGGVGETTTSAAGGGKGNVRRLLILDLTYEAWIDKSSTTALANKYTSIRPWLIQKIKDYFGVSSVAILSETRQAFPDENRIAARMTAAAAAEGATYLERRLTVKDSGQTPFKVVPAWTGSPFSAYIYEGEAIAERTVTETARRMGKLSSAQAAAEVSSLAAKFRENPFLPEAGGGGAWLVVRRDSEVTPLTLGLPGNQIEVTDVSASVVQRFVKPISQSASPSPTTRPTSGAAATTRPT